MPAIFYTLKGQMEVTACITPLHAGECKMLELPARGVCRHAAQG